MSKKNWQIAIVSAAFLIAVVPNNVEARVPFRQKPINVGLACLALTDLKGARVQPKDPYSWRCSNNEIISMPRACQLLFGPDWNAALNSKTNAYSWFCYSRPEYQRAMKAKALGKRFAAYLRRTQPSESFAYLYKSTSNDLIVQATADAITAHADDPLIDSGPGAYGDPDTDAELGRQLFNFMNPNEHVDALPPGLGERFEHAVMEWLSGRHTWSSALQRNFSEVAPSAQQGLASGKSAPSKEGGNEHDRDPNSNIGVHDKNEMEASTKEIKEYGGKSFGEQLKDAAEKNAKESKDGGVIP